MKKVSITIASKDYNITLEDEFAKFFEKDLKRFVSEGHSMDIKDLLSAFVQKSYESFQQGKSIEGLAKRLDGD